MGRRDLLSNDERGRFFGIPVDRDELARRYTFEPQDLELIYSRREDRNRLGFAVQLALVRHPGLTLAQVTALSSEGLALLVDFVARQLQLPVAAFRDYAAREQTTAAGQCKRRLETVARASPRPAQLPNRYLKRTPYIRGSFGI